MAGLRVVAHHRGGDGIGADDVSPGQQQVRLERLRMGTPRPFAGAVGFDAVDHAQIDGPGPTRSAVIRGHALPPVHRQAVVDHAGHAGRHRRLPSCRMSRRGSRPFSLGASLP